ncbi:MAG: hypothetical protein V1838_03540 [Patescibacteria group bacterium]
MRDDDGSSRQLLVNVMFLEVDSSTWLSRKTKLKWQAGISLFAKNKDLNQAQAQMILSLIIKNGLKDVPDFKPFISQLRNQITLLNRQHRRMKLKNFKPPRPPWK